MITPTHAVYNLALLGRRDRPDRTWPILLGAFFPDLPGTFCIFYSFVIQGRSLERIHEVIYPSAFWQGWADAFHSIPLALLLGAACLLLKWAPGAWFAASAVLHSLEDFPVHDANPHRHFWPLADWRFQSPLSCYGPGGHVAWVAAADFCLLAWAAWVLWRRGLPAWGKGLVGTALLLEAAHSILAVLKG
ncbi:MAG TPA: hypothetical protein VFR02_06740 [bacterium]|nr:hypothetical protein [bacterium]